MSEDYGKHLMGVEDLLQKHSLLEADINVVGERVKQVNGQAEKFVEGEFPEAEGYKPCDPQVVRDRMSHLDAAYEELQQLAADRRTKLAESRKLWQFYWDMADEDSWIKEKEQLMSSPDLGRDLTSVNMLLSKHKVKHVNLIIYPWPNMTSVVFCMSFFNNVRSRERYHFPRLLLRPA